MKHILVVAIAVASLASLSGGVAGAAPGDPFGGDDTGCVPSDYNELKCEPAIAKALGKLSVRLAKCHAVQNAHAFKNPNGSGGYSNAEDVCAEDNLSQSAKAKFDKTITKYATLCPPDVIANANALRDVLLGDRTVSGSGDELNGKFFCDTSSGLEIDPSGDDAGWVPSSAGGYKCSAVVARLYSKLVDRVYRCHAKAARKGFTSNFYDEEACEEGPTGALTKYNLKVQYYLDGGLCPLCLTDPGPGNALTLGSDVVAQLDAANGNIFICPAP